jgi:hypothetical protein
MGLNSAFKGLEHITAEYLNRQKTHHFRCCTHILKETAEVTKEMLETWQQ